MKKDIPALALSILESGDFFEMVFPNKERKRSLMKLKQSYVNQKEKALFERAITKLVNSKSIF